MLKLFYTENWQKVPFNTKCGIRENPAERGKDEKDIKKNHCFNNSSDDGFGDYGKCGLANKHGNG